MGLGFVLLLGDATAGKARARFNARSALVRLEDSKSCFIPEGGRSWRVASWAAGAVIVGSCAAVSACSSGAGGFVPLREGPAIRRADSATGPPAVDCVVAEVDRKGVDTLGVKRKLAPFVKRGGRGSVGKAIAAAACSRSDSVASLKRDFYSKTSSAPRAAVWVTIRRILVSGGLEALPLSEDKIVVLAAALKRGAYRAAKGYLYRAKQEHVRSGFAWSDALQDTLQLCVRSVSRGVGLAASAAAFMLEEVAANRLVVSDPNAPVVAGGVVGPFDAVIIASSWLMRGLEAATVLGEQVVVSDGGKLATIELGPTKTNPEGRECPRSLVCACARSESGVFISANPCCPVCAVVRLLRVREGLGLGGKHCLVCDSVGCAISSGKMIETLKEVAKDKRLSEHSMRRAGAQYYARKGVALFIIQFLGRWGSAAVEKYVGNAFLAVAAKASLGATSVGVNGWGASTEPAGAGRRTGAADLCGSGGPSDAVASFCGEVSRRLKGVALEFHGELAATRTAVTGGVKAVGPDKRVHKVLLGDLETPIDAWRTVCGWRFAVSAHTRVNVELVNCKRCTAGCC